jgi:prepilin-type N-terminal cleavage/methylation domain-containing protein
MLERIRKAKDEGFTLIELLIVVIILGILAAIVVFAIGSTKKDSVNATCRTDVKSIVLAEEAWNTTQGSYTALQGDLTGTKGTLKDWPTQGAAATDPLKLTLSHVAGDGGYTITIVGANSLSGSVTQADTSDPTVNTACGG